jgi:hypothetical protein
VDACLLNPASIAAQHTEEAGQENLLRGLRQSKGVTTQEAIVIICMAIAALKCVKAGVKVLKHSLNTWGFVLMATHWIE